MKSWKAWLLVGLIFATGAAVGAFGMRAYMVRHLPEMLAHTRKRLEEHFLDNIDREVGLSAEQRNAILPILKAAVEQGDKVHQSVRGQMDQIMGEADTRIAALLDAGQRARFQEFHERMERLRREGRPGGPPPGGPEGPGGPPPPGFPPGFPPGPPPPK
jgi:hypothetical protein